MLIRNNQIGRKTEEIIKRYLFNGTYPKLKSITNELSTWMENHIPGTPSFKSHKIYKKDITNSTEFNNQMTAIEKDISDVYEASITQQNQLMRNFTQGEIAREKIRHDIDQINKELDQLISMSKYADNKYIHEDIISFENLSTIDIKRTDASVDISKRQVTLKERNIQSKRIIVDSSKVVTNVLQSHTGLYYVQPVKYAFDDSINTAWWSKVTTKETNSKNKMELEIVIPFNDVTEINTIEFTPHHTKEMYVTLEYSSDNNSYSSISTVTDIKILEPTSWTFKNTKMRYLKIRIKKYQYDELEGKNWVYYFGAKNIAIYKKSYEAESYIYTNKLSLPSNSKSLSISSDKTKRVGTDIGYEICFNPEAKETEQIWHEIDDYENKSNGKTKSIEINNTETVSVSGRKVIETGELVNGIRSYKLLKNDGSSIFTPDNTGNNTFTSFSNAKLYKGIHQWKREHTYKEFNGDVPLNSMWDTLYREKANMIDTDYFIKTNSLPFNKSNENFYRFTICVYSIVERQMPLSIQLTGISNKELKKRLGSYSIYCNQKRLVSVNEEVTLNFVNGWNEIQILIHLGDVTTRKDLPLNEMPDNFIIGKTNLVTEQYVRADLFPMELISKESLFYNISPLNHDYFAIDQQQVILNYYPNDTIFELIYDEEKQTGDGGIPYLLRAKLSRSEDDDSITPILNDIRVRTI